MKKLSFLIMVSFAMNPIISSEPVSPHVCMDHPIKVIYTNWRNETAVRSIIPLKVYFGATEYHTQQQWLLEVWDIEKQATRVYALKEIKQWFVE